MSMFITHEEEQFMERFSSLSVDEQERDEREAEKYRCYFIVIRHIASTLGFPQECRMPQCRRARLCRAKSDRVWNGRDYVIFPPCAPTDPLRNRIRAYVRDYSAKKHAGDQPEKYTGKLDD